MTQRIFDVENEKDMADLWDILPNEIVSIKLYQTSKEMWCISNKNEAWYDISDIFSINWHDKTEITRPIQEATEQDIGKICVFFSSLSNSKYYGVLIELRETIAGTRYVAQSCNGTHPFVHAYRLTKQEIEELC